MTTIIVGLIILAIAFIGFITGIILNDLGCFDPDFSDIFVSKFDDSVTFQDKTYHRDFQGNWYTYKKNKEVPFRDHLYVTQFNNAIARKRYKD